MVKQSTLAWALALALTALACGGDDKPSKPVEGEPDAGGSPDASRPDSSTPKPDGSTPSGNDASVVDDAAAPVVDSGTPDSGGPVATPCDASKAPTVPALKLETVPGATGLNKLVFAAQAPGSDDWYLVQQGGTIRVLSNGALKQGNFLDVSSQITLQTSWDDERGLLGLAFAPDYATSGKFYVMMTPTNGANANRDSLLEYTRDGDVAGATPREIFRLAASDANHNGGNMVFDKNGLMFVGTGDGGGGCNNNNQAGGSQDPSSLFGKILRLDLKNESGKFAAAGNPFSGATGDERVWHYGLRNPYRFQLDRATNDLYIGDVGQDTYEEVDFSAAGVSGLNFGWPKFEGNHEGTCGNKDIHPGSTVTPPVIDIPRKTGLYSDYISVIMGVPYRGTAIPALQGITLFGDYKGARYQAFVQCADKTSPVTVFARAKNPNQPDQPGFSLGSGVQALSSLVAIVQGNDSELYLVANRTTLLKVVPGS